MEQDKFVEEAWNFSEETRKLVSINERFENESLDVQEVRVQFARAIENLLGYREACFQSGDKFAWRQVSMAITFAEQACEKAVKAIYAIKQ